jgi:glycosyltransferase involved in cell wall biosynthesis
VAHVATASGWRGGEQQVLYLLEGLLRRGLDSVLFTPGPSPLAAAARGAGIPVVPFRARGDLDVAAGWRLRSRLGSDVDVLHLHTGRAHAVGRLATWRRAGPRVVVSRRVDFPVKGGRLGRVKYAGVDRFIAVSREVARVLVAGGVPPERVRVVHSGVDPRRFAVSPDPQGLRRELGIPPNSKLVGFVGALAAHKAPEDLVEALSGMPDSVHAVFAGTGRLAARLRARARPLGNRVHFLGHRGDVPRLLRSIDAFCLPSHMEGLGTSVLDAMAAGTPVVAAAGGGIPEMVEDGVSGLLVVPGRPRELAAALERVLGEDVLRRRLIAGGAERVLRFSADRMAEETIRVYREVLDEAWAPHGGRPGS